MTLHPSRATLRADGMDAIVVNVQVEDANGYLVPNAGNLSTFNVSDNAAIIGVVNGDPSCHEPVKAIRRSAFNGLCQVIVQCKRVAGNIVLAAHADGLEPATLTLVAQAAAQRATGETP